MALSTAYITVAASIVLTTLSPVAFADFFSPTPSTSDNLGPDWQKIPNGMWYTGCLTVSVNQGCSGNGTINADSYKLGGVTLFPLPIAFGGTGATTAAAARTSLSAAKSGANSDITSMTGLTTVTGPVSFTALAATGPISSTTASAAYASTITIDLDGPNFQTIALTGNATMASPLHQKPGQSGCFGFTQGGTGSYSITSWASDFKWAGGPIKPTFSTNVGAEDDVCYWVKAVGNIHVSFGSNYQAAP